ncbi:hypothetical protein G4G28_15005 [Massilia sp. Dwa41.01b]|nr:MULTISPECIES: hypothetical protein [unclassified Massilia]QNA89457.1 hypothetical protein G4G28_15005 [Massilia sp. Dwa41.01b]QNB00360.1 hypothetical protein G4G31_18590 [Massilia sp. Se16.2.3]
MNALSLSFPADRAETTFSRLLRTVGAFLRRSLELSGDAYMHGAQPL